MDKKILWLRISYWAGAVLDVLAAIQMLFPGILGTMYQLPDFDPGVEYKFAMGMGASLMLGWTALLIWADRKPVERKSILLLTVFPVIFGIAATNLFAVTSGFVSFASMVPTWICQVALTSLFIFSYLNARDA